ncbi:LuxR family transcriptional regulator [Marinimicrobium sp. ABcell2]|uniref:response regulator transcription factor n=1 Tax=Marinimicrobium sp. ABcell2 TaxID=3069751 RepID=UPI0027B0579D|nr:helix-turn-helix transcriptional regulator [Marinimicrobium sp. ABcell2]MDQ2077796.1 helix-turn-helix transcriptional regulator [Marinimicrobium sp. ABcell2]
MLTDLELKAFNAFLVELYGSARDHHPSLFRRRTLQNLRKLLPFDFGAWGGGTAVDRMVTDVAILDQSADLFQAWESVASSDTYCDLALKFLNKTVAFNDVKGFRRSIAYNEHWRQFDARNMIATITPEPADGYVSFLGLCNSDSSNNFTAKHRYLKQLLMPHLSGALRMNREAAIDCRPAPDESVAVINCVGQVLLSRQSIDALLHEEWGPWQKGVPASILPGRGQSRRWRGRAVLIDIEPIGDNFLLKAHLLRPEERLTPRETQVAVLFAQGLSHKEVSCELGVAPATVRNHIANIYDRLKISDKANLARLLSSTV